MGSKRVWFTVDTTSPKITFAYPTPDNGSTIIANYAYINVTLSEPANTVLLVWNNVNKTMTGTGNNWYRNMTNLAAGNYTYRIWANDSARNTNTSETRTIIINYTTPQVSLKQSVHIFFPSGYSVNPQDILITDMILINDAETALEDGIRIIILDPTGKPVYRTWKRVKVNANDAIRIRFNDYSLPSNARSGVWMLKAEFTEDAKWAPPGFRYFMVS